MLKKDKGDRDESKRRMEDKAGPAESIIGPGTKFKGTIESSAGISIAGVLRGEIRSESLVKVEVEGKITGPVTARYIIVEGELNGDVLSAEHVELRSEGKITGNISTEKLAMAEGSFFEGKIEMPGGKNKPIRFVEKRKGEEPAEEAPEESPEQQP